MKRTLYVVLAAMWMMSVSAAAAQAQNLLANGDLESDGISGWSLQEFVTSMPGVAVNAAQLQDFANLSGPFAGEAGLWLRPFAGNTGAFAGQNQRTNAVLSQTVAGVAGETYTLTSWANVEPNYSGGVNTLDPMSPSGNITSPTETILELAFLDAGHAVLEMPATLDLRNVPFFPGFWQQLAFMGTAPAGTQFVRVTASASNMIFNVDPQQSAFLDDFSLRRAAAPAVELLQNGDLNSHFTPGWSLSERPGEENNLQLIYFANRPASFGDSGVWLKAFLEGDASVSQVVPAVAGLVYEFSGWSAFELGYAGGLPGTTTKTFLEMTFLDAQQMPIDGPLMLDLREAGQTNAVGPIDDHPDAWRRFTISAMAPPATAFVQVRAGATGMTGGTDVLQSAFFDDFALIAVPEPASLHLVGIAVFGMAIRRRKKLHRLPRQLLSIAVES